MGTTLVMGSGDVGSELLDEVAGSQELSEQQPGQQQGQHHEIPNYSWYLISLLKAEQQGKGEDEE